MLAKIVIVNFQSSPLLAPTAAGVASVQVPDQGWIIFGGEGGTAPASQLLKNISKISDLFNVFSYFCPISSFHHFFTHPLLELIHNNVGRPLPVVGFCAG